MRTKRIVLAVGLVALVAAAGVTARAETAVTVLAGATFPALGTNLMGSNEDGYGTVADDDVRLKGRTGADYGLAVGWIGSSGLGLELSAEEATLDIHARTNFALSWESIEGFDSESFVFGKNGDLTVRPVSLDLVFRGKPGTKIDVTASCGVSWVHYDLKSKLLWGAPIVVGDTLEAIPAEARLDANGDGVTWNAGVRAGWHLADHLDLVFDARWYGDTGPGIEEVKVHSGSYTGLHTGATVEVDGDTAAALADQVAESTAYTQIDTRYVRAAFGVAFHF